MRLFKNNIPRHTYGRGYSFDLANSNVNEYAVGAFAIIKDIKVKNGNTTYDYYRNKNIAKVSLSTDGDRVIHPTLPLQGCLPIKATANLMMQPVDFVQLGNRLNVVIEEFQEPTLMGKEVSYTLCVYIKTQKGRYELCYRR